MNTPEQDTITLPSETVQQALETLETMTTLTSRKLRDKCPSLILQLRAALTASQEPPLLQKSFAELRAERKADHAPEKATPHITQEHFDRAFPAGSQAQADEPKIAGYQHEVETFDAQGYSCYKTIVTDHPKPVWSRAFGLPENHGGHEVTKINATEPLITLQSHREAMAEADGVRRKAVIELSEHLIGANQLMLEQRDALAKKDAALKAQSVALRIAVQQSGHDMLMTGEELRQCEAAITQAQEALK